MALQDDFKKYFEAVQPGQVVEVPGGGAVTRNADGTATFSNGQYSYNYSANTSTDEVAKNVPALAAQWAQTYGTPAPAAPFNSLDEYKQWEAANVQNGPAQMAAGYEVPDYIRQMGLSRAAGDDGAFKRFLFFKNNPQYAQDYANIHNGQVSRFASDGSTLQRTDMSTLTPEAQALYGSNPGALAMAEGFNFDPNLYASRMNSVAPANNRTNSASYLQQNAMDAQGNITASNNSAKASEWARNNPNYKVNAYDRATGGLLDNGSIYDAVSGQPIFASSNQDRLATELSQPTPAGGGGQTGGVMPTPWTNDKHDSPSNPITGGVDPYQNPGMDTKRTTTGIGLDQIQGLSRWDIDADQTVAGQLSKILADDSPLMQQARARALQQMNGRGLTNSSMAQSAADSAMYDQAMQIAQQDAGTYAERGKYNTDSKNTFSRDNNAFVRDAFMADFNLEANNWLAEQNFNREYKMLDKSQQQELERMAVSNGYQSARDQYLNQWQKEAASQSNDWQKEAASQSNNWQKVILDIQQKHSLEMEKLRQQYSSSQSGSETDNAEKAQAKADLQNALSKFASDAFKLDTSSMDPDVADQAYNNLAQSYNAIIKIATQKLGWKFEDWDIDLRTKPTTETGTGGAGGGGTAGGGASGGGFSSPGDSGA